MINESGMWYPVHLHGRFIRLLVTGGERRSALRAAQTRGEPPADVMTPVLAKGIALA
jgi:hypothetical protein